MVVGSLSLNCCCRALTSVDRLVIDYANLLDGNVKKKKVYFVQFHFTKQVYMNVIAVSENVTILSQYAYLRIGKCSSFHNRIGSIPRFVCITKPRLAL
jgi:ABC-type metal ion transport system substrate-binding protein